MSDSAGQRHLGPVRPLERDETQGDDEDEDSDDVHVRSL